MSDSDPRGLLRIVRPVWNLLRRELPDRFPIYASRVRRWYYGPEIARIRYYRLAGSQSPRISPDNEFWIDRLNNVYESNAKIFGVLQSVPNIRDIDEIAIGQRLNKLVNNERNKLRGKNEPHGLLSEIPSILNLGALNFNSVNTDYAVVKTLRECLELPPIISSGTFVCSSELGKIALHSRGLQIDTHPGALHIFGGSYKPPTDVNDNDGGNLKETAKRELNEEAQNANFQLQEFIGGPIIFSQELTTGFVQFIFPPLDVSAERFENMKPSREGHIVRFGISELKDHILSHAGNGWCPSGQMAILAWLRLGAHTNKSKCLLNSSAEAEQIFEDCIRQSGRLRGSWSKWLPKW